MDTKVNVPRLIPTPMSSHHKTPPRPNVAYSHISSLPSERYHREQSNMEQPQSQPQLQSNQHKLIPSPSPIPIKSAKPHNSVTRSHFTHPIIHNGNNGNGNNVNDKTTHNTTHDVDTILTHAQPNVQPNANTHSHLFHNFHMPNVLIRYGNEISIACFFILLLVLIYYLSWLFAKPSLDTLRRNHATQKVFREKLSQLKHQAILVDNLQDKNHNRKKQQEMKKKETNKEYINDDNKTNSTINNTREEEEEQDGGEGDEEEEEEYNNTNNDINNDINNDKEDEEHEYDEMEFE